MLLLDDATVTDVTLLPMSVPQDREKRFLELKEMLIDRDYKPRLITAAIDRARSVSREEALKKVVRQKSSDRPVLVIQFDPRMPSLPRIVQKHWRSMISADPYLRQVFPLPPLIAYRRPKNIREMVIKARVPPVYIRPTRIQTGYKKCTNVSCLTCPYSIPGKLIKSSASDFKIEVNASVNCKSRNIIYLLTCKHCGDQYVGETDREANKRLIDHRGYVNRNDESKATGFHFNLPGHSVSDIQFQIIEKVFNNNPWYRKEREKMYINKFCSKLKGINKVS